MSAQARSALVALYGASGSQFPDNTTGDITPAIERDFGQALTDSHFNLIDDKFSGSGGVNPNITDTTGLKAIVTVGVAVGVIVFYRDSHANIKGYQLTSGTSAESSPSIIRPTDYNGSTNQKIWKLCQKNGDTYDLGTTSGTLSVNVNDVSVVTIKPNGACTFNVTGGANGQRVSFVIITAGTSSYTLTFGTGLNNTGTLATGTSDSKAWTVNFICINGGDHIETGRSGPMTYSPLP